MLRDPVSRPEARAIRWPQGQCVLCRSWCATGLCLDCLQRFAPSKPRCARCGRVTALAVDACGGCLRAPPAWDRTITLADYDGPWPALIMALKFNHQVELASALAMGLATVVSRSDAPRPDLLIPVPLSPARLRERGFNQAWELARRIGRRLGVPASPDALQRVRDTAHQIGKTRVERERNLRDAFWVQPCRSAPAAGRRLALIDDVLTTGATAQAAALALRRAGAAGVDLWVLARTTLGDR
jgi:ComF family protein